MCYNKIILKKKSPYFYVPLVIVVIYNTFLLYWKAWNFNGWNVPQDDILASYFVLSNFLIIFILLFWRSFIVLSVGLDLVVMASLYFLVAGHPLVSSFVLIRE